MTKPTITEMAIEFTKTLIRNVSKDIEVAVVVTEGKYVAVAASDPELGERINKVFSDNPIFLGHFPVRDNG